MGFAAISHSSSGLDIIQYRPAWCVFGEFLDSQLNIFQRQRGSSPLQNRPSFWTSRLSISILFFINKAYLEANSWFPALTESLQLRADFSNMSLYKHAIGTKLPFLLHSQPWAALNAAPRDAESANQVTGLLHQKRIVLWRIRQQKDDTFEPKKKKKEQKDLGFVNLYCLFNLDNW